VGQESWEGWSEATDAVGASSAAFVGSEHTVEAHAGHESGANRLRQCPQLIEYADAFMASGRSLVRFLWQDADRRWLHVSLERLEDSDRVRVTMTPNPLPARLTSREVDVLSLLVGGLSNREIAECLVLSVRTVSTHLEHILTKLGESSRAGAAAVAAERGWLRLPIPGRGAPVNNLTVSLLDARVELGPISSLTRRGRRGAPSKRPLIVGSIIPLSGPVAADGREMLNGSTLAISELNARGGVAGRWLEHVVVDTNIFSATDVERAFRELADVGVDAITSGYVFVEHAAREAALQYGAPYLHSMTSEDHASIVADNPARYAGIFQICPTEVHYPTSFLHFVDELRSSGRWHQCSNRIAFIDTTLPSGKMVTEPTVNAAGRLDLEIALVETVEPVGVDWTPIVERIVRADPAAVMITQFLASELAGFQQEITRCAPNVLVYATYTPSIPEFLELAGPAAEGIVWTTVTGTYSDTIGQGFESRFNRMNGHRPGRSQAGLAYDGIHLLAQTWAGVTNPQDFVHVAKQLRLSRYRGVNGAYFLDNPAQSGLNFPYTTSDPSLGQAHLVFQVQDGEHRIIGPAPYAETTVRC
jgi:branched-chain amino acid transport system substrate-binding protein